MNELSELDLQNLRHLIGGFDTTHCKMTAYAQEAGDPGCETVFPEICTVRDAVQTAADDISAVTGGKKRC